VEVLQGRTLATKKKIDFEIFTLALVGERHRHEKGVIIQGTPPACPYGSAGSP
jgi:hypothetical protein